MKNEQMEKPKGVERGKAGQTVVPPPENKLPEEVGGPKGLEPTRYGDWERNGRVSDF